LIYKCLLFHAAAVQFAVQWVVRRAEDPRRDEDASDLLTRLAPFPVDYFRGYKIGCVADDEELKKTEKKLGLLQALVIIRWMRLPHLETHGYLVPL
jgi:hypothetical protein